MIEAGAECEDEVGLTNQTDRWPCRESSGDPQVEGIACEHPPAHCRRDQERSDARSQFLKQVARPGPHRSTPGKDQRPLGHVHQVRHFLHRLGARDNALEGLHRQTSLIGRSGLKVLEVGGDGE
jgi:hypothetical protein